MKSITLRKKLKNAESGKNFKVFTKATMRVIRFISVFIIK